MESLQEICISKIVENFTVYSGWFAKCEGTTYDKQFEFLRRAYSDTLFSKLLKDLEEQHLDFLINRHLKHLDISSVDDKLIESIAKKLKTNGNGIETIKARFSKLLYEQLIPSSSHLVDIEVGEARDIHARSIYDTDISEVIKSLGRNCPALRVLKLNDDSYRHLGFSGLPKGLKLCPGFYKAISYLLDRCPSLEILGNINTVEILHRKHKADFQRNDLGKYRKYSLKKLSCVGKNYPLMEAFEICFHLCPKVTCIELHWMDGNQLVKCPDFKALQDDKILVDYVTIGYMSEFLKIRGSKLVNLKLFHSHISVQTIIRCCPELKHLTLHDIQECEPVRQEDFPLFAAGLPKLKSFCVHWNIFSCNYTGEVVRLIISAAENLEAVDFRFIRGFTEKFCNSIFDLGLHRVPELNVDNTDIPVSFLIKLLLQGNIKKLNFWYPGYVTVGEDPDNLIRYKQANQTVSVKCLYDWLAERHYHHEYDEW